MQILRRFIAYLWWLVVAVFLASRAVHWWCEAWWFESNGYSSLYNTMLVTRCVMFVVSAGLYGSFLWLNVHWARRIVARSATLPVVRSSRGRPRAPLLPPADKAQIDRYRDWILGGLVVLAAWLAGLYGSLHWIHLPRFFGAFAIGPKDPIFGRDLSFHLFQLPALDFAWGMIYGAGICALLLSLLIYAYEGILELAGARPHLATSALPHLARLAAALLAWKAIGYPLQSYNLLSRPGGSIQGIGSVEQVWALPILRLLPLLALATAAWLWWQSGRPPEKRPVRQAFAALGVFILTSFLLGVAMPTLLLNTEPLDSLRNSSYLQSHIRWTRQAYGLDNVQETYPKTSVAARTASIGTENKPVTENVASLQRALSVLPAWSPETLSRFLHGTAAGETPWQVSPPQLDRYRIGGEWRPVFVATRTLDPTSLAGASWQDRHFVPAYGAGLVMCDAQRTDAAGHPVFYDKLAPTGFDAAKTGFFYGDFATVARFASTFPTRGMQSGEPAFSADNTLPVGRTRLQPPFETPNGRSVAEESPWERSTLGTTRPAFDYFIRDGVAGQASGVTIGARWRQWILGWRFADLNLALSSQVGPTNRLDWHHDVVERCRTLVPFLNFADAPLPVRGNDGRLVWLVDGFAIANSYPYARPLNGSGGINYLRHSVTATVDAESGQVRFYVTDESDAYIRLYQRLFPDTFLPLAEIPATYREHLRYPLLLLTAQAEIWARYHSDEPKLLRQEVAEWSRLDLADDPLRFLHPNQLPSDYVVQPAVGGLELSAIFTYTPSVIPQPRTTAATAKSPPATGPTVAGFLMGSRQNSSSNVPRPSVWRPSQPVPLPPVFSRTANQQPANRATLLRQADHAAPISIALLPLGRTILGVRSDHENAEVDALPEFPQRRRYLIAEPRIQVVDRSPQGATNAFELRRNILASTTTSERGKRTAQPATGSALQQARDLYRRMQQARRKSDWATYGALEARLGAVLEGR